MKDIVMQLDQVSVRRSHSDRAQVQHVSATIYAGEVVALCGPNGAGKSTLARAILGLYPLSSGRIGYGDDAQAQPSRPVHMVFQPPIAQLVGDTVFEDLSITLLQRHPHLTRPALDETIAGLCERVGLRVAADTHLRRLSAGQLHRLCIAEALASNAKLIIVDEGLSALDPGTRKQMMRQFRMLAEQQGTSFIVVTHDLENVLDAHRVLVMDDGELVADSRTSEFFYSEDGLQSPCVSFGMTPPYLIQTALSWNRLAVADEGRENMIKPLDEMAFVEAIRRANGD